MTINIDAELHNADWPKRTWDIYDDDGKLVTTLSQLKATMFWEEPSNFLKHPGLPPQLRKEILINSKLQEYAAHTYVKGHHPNQYIHGIGSFNIGITTPEIAEEPFGAPKSLPALENALHTLKATNVSTSIAIGGWKNDSGDLFEEKAFSLGFTDGAPQNVTKEMATLGRAWHQEAVLVQQLAEKGELQAVVDFGRGLDEDEIREVGEAIKTHFGGWTFAQEIGKDHTDLVVSNIGAWGGIDDNEFTRQVKAVAEHLEEAGEKPTVGFRHVINYPLDTSGGGEDNANSGETRSSNKESVDKIEGRGIYPSDKDQRNTDTQNGNRETLHSNFSTGTGTTTEWWLEAREYSAHTYARGHHPNQYIRGSGKAPKLWNGEPIGVENDLNTYDKGQVGEKIALAWLQQNGYPDAIHANEKEPNFPVDIIADHRMAAEVKAGSVANSKKAQWWRFTIGEPGKAEKAWIAQASAKQLAAWNVKKQKDIVVRKNREVAALEKEYGSRIETLTVTSILNNDTHTADLFVFKGFHERLYWKDASAAYVGTFKYG